MVESKIVYDRVSVDGKKRFMPREMSNRFRSVEDVTKYLRESCKYYFPVNGFLLAQKYTPPKRDMNHDFIK